MEKTLAHIQGVEHGAVKNMEEMMGAKGHELIAHTLAIEEKVKRAGELGVQIAEMAKDASDTQESLDEDKQFYADMERSLCSMSSKRVQRRESAADLIPLVFVFATAV